VPGRAGASVRVFPDLLRPMSTAASLEAGLARTLRRIVRLTGAAGGALVFRPPRREPVAVTVAGSVAPPVRDWLAALAAGRGPRRPDVAGARALRLALGAPPHPVGELVLIGGRRRAPQVPPDFPRELGAALELLDESRRRADELSALYATSRLITARLDLASVLERISRSVTALIGSTGCGIGLVDAGGRTLVHAAAHGFKTAEWRALVLPVGEGIIGRCAESAQPILVDDIRRDPRSARRDVDEREGIRSMLCVPMMLGERLLGVISAFSTRPAVFTPHHQRVLGAFGEQAAIAIHNAHLHGELEARVHERTRQLDEEKRFVEVVLETLPLGVFVLDAALAVVRANPAATAVLRDGTLGRRAFRALFPGEKGDAIDGFLRGAVADGGVRTMEEEIALAGGARTLRLTAVALAAPGESPGHLVVLVEDLTRAKRLEQQMLLAERLTTAGRLAAGVAHELNNPLATIAGCAESLLERTRDLDAAAVAEIRDLRGYLATIEEEAYRCKEITGTLLQFVRDPGSRREATDVNALVTRSVELLTHQSRFTGSTIVTALDPAVRDVRANEGQLRQVVLGIAANALEAMSARGRLTIRTRLAGDEVVIEFADEGPGIPEDVLPRIFDPFFTTKAPAQGTGLGLAIAQGIVADHGGRIEVASKPGEGAVFRVVLPA
jgi:signal transduction histidine kinase/putative methionine-R-sulfoxide reductase with GAF domain